jgi:hypothetical protein
LWLKAATDRWEQSFPDQGDLFEPACAQVWRTLAPSLRACASTCADCGIDTVEAGEWYMVHDEIWLRAWDHISRSAPGLQILCIGCLEQRIGRTLCAEDFTDVPINDPHKYKSERMRERLTARCERRTQA